MPCTLQHKHRYDIGFLWLACAATPKSFVHRNPRGLLESRFECSPVCK
jgi:hypothetical protein